MSNNSQPKVTLKKGTKIYLSNKGYYNYSYINLDCCLILPEDTQVTPCFGWKAGVGNEKWNAYIMDYKKLSDYPKRGSNVVWVKQNPERG